MPVTPETLGLDPEVVSLHDGTSGYLTLSKDTLQLSDTVRLVFLSDRITLPRPLNVVYSVGDVFIVAGISIYVLHLFLTRRRYRAAAF